MQEQSFNELPDAIKEQFDAQTVRAGDFPPDEKFVLLTARKEAIKKAIRTGWRKRKKRSHA